LSGGGESLGDERVWRGKDTPSPAQLGLKRQGTLLGVYRWLVLSLIAYILAHWAYLSSGTTDLPDWGQAAQLALQVLLPQLSKVPFFTRP
jgi:hypothetical protein